MSRINEKVVGRVKMVKLDTRQKGRCGELLVQYCLLKHGVESAPLTTDTGIDLVAYSSIGKKPVTIQVKTSSQHDRDGDRWLEWQIPEGCPADYIAAVDLDRSIFWLIETKEFNNQARRTSRGKRRLLWAPTGFECKRTRLKEEQFRDYEMNTAIPKAFGI